MNLLYIGLLAGMAVVALAVYSSKVRTARNRAAEYAGHPPGSGHDVYDETLLKGIQLELERLRGKGRELYSSLDLQPLDAYLGAHSEDHARWAHGAAVDTLCARADHLARSGQFQVPLMHEMLTWVSEVQEWKAVTWWLMPMLRHGDQIAQV